MFTGLIETTATVIANLRTNDSCRLIISSPFDRLETGESIAVNGVCLTLLPSTDSELHFDVSSETLKVTTFAHLSAGEVVNLERAMVASTRFGGHYVSGHVDLTARIKSVHAIDEYIEVEVEGFDPDAMLFLIPKGSVTMDGVSLTINAITEQSIKLMLVPHTLLHTTLSKLKAQQSVNIEFDYLTRIVAHQLQIAGKLNYEVKA